MVKGAALQDSKRMLEASSDIFLETKSPPGGLPGAVKFDHGTYENDDVPNRDLLNYQRVVGRTERQSVKAKLVDAGKPTARNLRTGTPSSQGRRESVSRSLP